MSDKNAHGICDCCHLKKLVRDWAPDGAREPVLLCRDCQPTTQQIEDADRMANEQIWDAAGR